MRKLRSKKLINEKVLFNMLSVFGLLGTIAYLIYLGHIGVLIIILIMISYGTGIPIPDSSRRR